MPHNSFYLLRHGSGFYGLSLLRLQSRFGFGCLKTNEMVRRRITP